jgi:DDE domain
VTVYRWVLRCTALLADAATPGRHAVGRRWQVDQTSVKVAGQWRYVYRAIDQFGQVIDVFVSARRDAIRAGREALRVSVMPVQAGNRWSHRPRLTSAAAARKTSRTRNSSPRQRRNDQALPRCPIDCSTSARSPAWQRL